VPEGDTIHTSAERLRAALAGRPIVRFEARLVRRSLWPAPGVVVEDVRAHGKNLIMTFSNGSTLLTHLRMNGEWHVYGTGERWWKSRAFARAVVEVPGVVAVCFQAPVVEIHDRTSIPRLASLGPDLCEPEPDIDEALRRLGSAPGRAIEEALLDQRIASGIGNVYKSEVLYLCRVHPRTPVGSLAEERRRALLETAARLLLRNVGSSRRRTVPTGLAVYARASKPCLRCGTAIAMAKGARVTYWCPQCQPASEEAARDNAR
jgi:endonuclease-8